MGPRLKSRGKVAETGTSRTTSEASMGPRLKSRGKRDERGIAYGEVMLQWGRG